MSEYRCVLKSSIGKRNRSVVIAKDDFLNYITQGNYYDIFKDKSLWQQRDNKIMGKTVLQPRLNFSWGKDYYYSGGLNKASDSIPKDLETIILEVKSKVEEFLKSTFDEDQILNQCMIQWYRDQNDCIFPHCDNEKTFDRNCAALVCIVTLYPALDDQSYRFMRFSSGKETPEYTLENGQVVAKPYKHKIIDVPLLPGQLLVFSGNTHDIRHEVPRSKTEKCGRISLSFRTFT